MDFIFPFGKYTGNELWEVKDAYLEWIVRKKIYDKLRLPKLRDACIYRGLLPSAGEGGVMGDTAEDAIMIEDD